MQLSRGLVVTTVHKAQVVRESGRGSKGTKKEKRDCEREEGERKWGEEGQVGEGRWTFGMAGNGRLVEASNQMLGDKYSIGTARPPVETVAVGSGEEEDQRVGITLGKI